MAPRSANCRSTAVITVIGSEPSGGMPPSSANDPNTSRCSVLAVQPAQAALAWVTNQGDDTVAAVDTATGQVVQTVPVGAKPAGVALSPDGRRIYVTNPEGRSLSVVTRGAGAPAVREVPAGAGPQGLPLGVQVVGGFGQDAAALAWAEWVRQAAAG